MRLTRDIFLLILPRSSFDLEAMKGVEPLSSGLQDRRSVYPVELHRRNSVGSRQSVESTDGRNPDSRLWTADCFLVELRGVEPLRPACKAGIIPLDHSPGTIGDFQLPIADLLAIESLVCESQSEIGNWQSAMNVVAEAGFEPTTFRL